jgi:hypothetical protein
MRTSGDRPHSQDYVFEITEVYMTKLLDNDELLLRYASKDEQGIVRYLVAFCFSETPPPPPTGN